MNLEEIKEKIRNNIELAEEEERAYMIWVSGLPKEEVEYILAVQDQTRPYRLID